MTAKPWFKSRHHDRNNDAIVENLFYYTAPANQRDELIEGFRQYNRETIINPVDLKQVLEDWQYEVGISMIPYPEILLQKPPVIAHFPKAGGYVMIHEIRDGQLSYIDPGKGWMNESVEAFTKHWKGLVLLAWPGQKDLLGQINDKKLDFQMAAGAYRKDLYTRENFLSPEQCGEIIEQAQRSLRPSKVTSSSGNAQKADFRSSLSAPLSTKTSKIAQQVIEKIVQEFKLPSHLYLETLQIVSYETGQEYEPHFDSITKTDGTQRVRSCIIYLNDDFEGGSTFFPELALDVKPKTGSLFSWELLTETKRINRFSLHAGLPVEAGVKYICIISILDKARPG